MSQVKKRILCIDDDFGFREAVKLILTKAGYELETAENGEEGLRKIEETRILLKYTL